MRVGVSGRHAISLLAMIRQLSITFGGTYRLDALLYPTCGSGDFEDRSGFDESADAITAVFAAHARELEAAPGRLRIVGHAIDHHAACANLLRDAPGAREILAAYEGVETIFGIIGDPNGIGGLY